MKNKSPKSRIQRFATVAAGILRVWVTAIGACGIILFVGLLVSAVVSLLVNQAETVYSWSDISLIFALLFATFLFLALRQLRRFFSHLQSGEIFDREGIAALWRAGAYALAYGVISVGFEVSTVDFSTEHFFVAAEILSALSGLFVGAALIFFSWLLSEGARIEEENRLTI